MEPFVCVVGSVNVDLVVRAPRLPRPGETVTGGTFHRQGGGKGANQAVAAARAGARVRLVGAVGDDELGRGAVAALQAEGIDTGGVLVLPQAPTGVALVVVDAAGENQIAVAPGANALLPAEHVAAALADLPSGGVLLCNLEAPDEALVAGGRRARAAGLRLLCNPAPARPLPQALVDLGPLLVPNAGEAAALTGEEEPEAAARALHARTRTPVVVTLGAAGALVAEAGGCERYPAFPVRAVDTTGAGDTFCGVLAARLAAGRPLGEAVRWALAAAALSVTALGARGGMPRAAEVEAFLAGRR